MPHIAHSAEDLQPGHGKPGGFNWVFDMSLCERSVAEQRAHVTERLAILGAMTGRIWHDFRNILAIIESSLRFAETHSVEPEKINSSVAAARDGIDRGPKLNSQLLAFAKLLELPAYAANANEYLRTLEHVGGHISVTSLRGGGTTFDLWFPSIQPREINGDRHEGMGNCSPR